MKKWNKGVVMKSRARFFIHLSQSFSDSENLVICCKHCLVDEFHLLNLALVTQVTIDLQIFWTHWEQWLIQERIILIKINSLHPIGLIS